MRTNLRRRKMDRKIVLLVCVFVFGIAGLSLAADAGKEKASSTTIKGAVNKPVAVGNTICPVSGEQIDEMTKATYVYEGKIYNFCCPKCIDTFKKDPQKYIKKIEQQKADATKAQPMDMQHHH